MSHNSKEKHFQTAFIQLHQLKHQGCMSDLVIEKAAYLYRKIKERGMTNGIPFNIAITAVLYIACREMEIPRTLKEISDFKYR